MHCVIRQVYARVLEFALVEAYGTARGPGESKNSCETDQDRSKRLATWPEIMTPAVASVFGNMAIEFARWCSEWCLSGQGHSPSAVRWLVDVE